MKKRISLILTICIVLLSGCQSINLTSDEEDLVAEYAANSILQRSYSYDKVLVDTSETGISVEETQSTTNTVVAETDSKTENLTNLTKVSLKEALNVNDFDVAFNSYQLVDSYPDSVTSDTTFSLNAADGSKLLLIKINITNPSTNSVNLDMQSKNLKYYLTVNGKEILSAKLTILLDDMNKVSGDFAANETKEMLLIFQISNEYSTNINSLDLMTVNGSNQYITSLK